MTNRVKLFSKIGIKRFKINRNTKNTKLENWVFCRNHKFYLQKNDHYWRYHINIFSILCLDTSYTSYTGALSLRDMRLLCPNMGSARLPQLQCNLLWIINADAKPQRIWTLEANRSGLEFTMEYFEMRHWVLSIF